MIWYMCFCMDMCFICYVYLFTWMCIPLQKAPGGTATYEYYLYLSLIKTTVT